MNFVNKWKFCGKLGAKNDALRVLKICGKMNQIPERNVTVMEQYIRRRSRNAMIAQAQRDAKVRSYTLNEEERRRTHTTGRSSSGRPKR